MRSPDLAELPPPLAGRSGWPWTEAAPRLPPTLPDGSPWPRLSIVTPSYNRRAFIEESLRSVLLQGYPDLELVVMDGASGDGTGEILDRYRPWIAALESAPDRGWRHAVNKGLARCSGQIATFFSSDDLYLPGAFGAVGRRWPGIADHGAVVGGFFHIDQASRPIERQAIPARLPRPIPVRPLSIPP